uniref:Protein kinase domain-containing protein n=1 Tax=Rhodnius prolixus TaxID=13249 RepID=T1HCM6_RHOPR
MSSEIDSKTWMYKFWNFLLKVYKVTVETPQECWFVFRRYNEFYKLHDSLKKQVLSKKLIMKRNEVRHIMSERNVLLKNLEHPFLVGLKFSFQTFDNLYFVLDYINGGDLYYHLQRETRFSEARARFYAAEITCAVGHLHSLGVIYRDLKPENILVDSDGHIMLTDFGLSKESDRTDTLCGTPQYLAPEVIRKEVCYTKSTTQMAYKIYRDFW